MAASSLGERATRVVIEDPTDWPGAIVTLAMLAMVASVGYLVLRMTRRAVVFVLDVIVSVSMIMSMTVAESAREAAVVDSNVRAVEAAYKIRRLSQADDGRPGGGEWLDPSAGTVTSLRVTWTDDDGGSENGTLVMDATGDEPTARLLRDGAGFGHGG